MRAAPIARGAHRLHVGRAPTGSGSADEAGLADGAGRQLRARVEQELPRDGVGQEVLVGEALERISR